MRNITLIRIHRPGIAFRQYAPGQASLRRMRAALADIRRTLTPASGRIVVIKAGLADAEKFVC